MEDKEIISQAMSMLGSRVTEKKSKSSANNLIKARTQRVLKPCTCGQDPITTPVLSTSENGNEDTEKKIDYYAENLLTF